MYKHIHAKQPRVHFNTIETPHFIDLSSFSRSLPSQHQKSLLTELYLRHCLNRDLLSPSEREKELNNLGFIVFTYVPKAIYVDVYLCVCWRMRSGAGMERVVANERNPSGKTLLPENLLAGLQADGGKRRTLHIQTPPSLSLRLLPNSSFLRWSNFFCLFSWTK